MADKDSTFPWFRFYTEVSHDIKLETIADDLGIDYLVVIGAWSMILCLASESPIRGSLYVTTLKRYSNVTVTGKLKCTEEFTEKIMQSFIDYDMLVVDENGAYQVKNWEKRQPKSDNGSIRVQKHRENNRCNDFVTLQKRYSNGLDLDTDTDIDKEEKLNSAPPSSQFSDGFYMRVWSSATNMAAIPGSEIEKVLPAMDALRTKYISEVELINAMKSYFEDWKSRKTKAGLPYNPSNCAWFYDFMVAGTPLKKDTVKPTIIPKVMTERADPDCPKCHGKGRYNDGTRFIRCSCISEMAVV